MDDKDIEQQLKESVQKIEMKEFSVRMEAIQDRLRTEEETDSVKQKELVLAAEGANEVHISNRKNLLFFVGGAMLICALFLAIFLPLTLRNNNLDFYNTSQLSKNQVTSEQFYDEMSKTEISLPNMSNMYIHSYDLLINPEKEISGCRVEIVEDEGLYLAVEMYDSTVIINSIVDESFSNVEYNQITLQYKIDAEEGYYHTTAYATDGKTKYVLDCISVEENVTTVFEKLFG